MGWEEIQVECFACGAGMKPDKVSFRFASKGIEITVLNVPANVCPRCGEQAFSQEVARGLEQIKAKVDAGKLRPKKRKTRRNDLQYAMA